MTNRDFVAKTLFCLLLCGITVTVIAVDPLGLMSASADISKQIEESKQQNVARDQERKTLHARLMDQCLEERAEYECILKVGQAVQVAIP